MKKSDYCPLHVKNNKNKPVRLNHLNSESKSLEIISTSPKTERLKDSISGFNESYQKVSDIKMMIFKNSIKKIDQYYDLIGPVYNDLTVSEDNSDPISMETFWKIIDGKKVVLHTETFDLFSYKDKDGMVRCLTIQTLCDMKDNLIHPLTGEEFPDEAKERAKKLIKIYTDVVLIDNIDIPEKSLLESKIVELFQELNIIGISLDSQIFVQLSDIQLANFVENFKKLTKNNISNEFIFKNSFDKMIILDDLKEFITIHKKTHLHQIACWLIVSALHVVSQEVRAKYPDIKIENF